MKTKTQTQKKSWQNFKSILSKYSTLSTVTRLGEVMSQDMHVLMTNTLRRI